MSRFWMWVDFVGAGVWAFLAVGVILGATPSKWTIVAAFLFVAVALLKSGVEYRLKMWQERLRVAKSWRL